MTGMEWDACTDPRQMFDALRRRGTNERKWWLFVASFWRWHAPRLDPPDELLERADDAEYLAETGKLPNRQRPSAMRTVFFASEAAIAAANTIDQPVGWVRGRMAARAYQVDLIRELFGNPFRPPEIEPHWRTSDVIGLARGIYEEPAFERLPILADALMDAGCGDERIIGHCRLFGPHVRGCWLLDRILGKD